MMQCSARQRLVHVAPLTYSQLGQCFMMLQEMWRSALLRPPATGSRALRMREKKVALLGSFALAPVSIAIHRSPKAVKRFINSARLVLKMCDPVSLTSSSRRSSRTPSHVFAGECSGPRILSTSGKAPRREAQTLSKCHGNPQKFDG